MVLTRLVVYIIWEFGTLFINLLFQKVGQHCAQFLTRIAYKKLHTVQSMCK